MEGHPHPKSIVIIDFGGQYAHLIARRVREHGAFSVIVPAETPAKALKDAAGIILSGGPQSVYEKGSPQADPKIFELGIPVLGLCYGHQWIAYAIGGEVKPGKTKEYGKTKVELVESGKWKVESGIFKNVPEKFVAWMSHGDSVAKMPPGFSVIAQSSDCPIAGMMDPERKIFGLQFHIEVTHTEHGQTILKNFIELCHPAPWSIESYQAHVGEELRKEVGDRHVFMLVSGGVDSTVAFTLLNEVIGHSRVQGLLVDTGLMRKGEIAAIQSAFQKLGIKNLKIEDASKEFFAALHGVTEPEKKRQIIGDTFLAVQKRISEQMQLTPERGWMLGQGTIYPDTIETGATKHADKIKTHHNRVEAIQKMIDAGLVIEPLKELYKDEVRKLGEELGLPHDLVWRHPFPGPGLGVRILCAEESSKGQGHKGTSETGIEPLALAPLSIPLPHAVLPIRSVGVQGDGRTYRHALVVFTGEPAVVAPELLELATHIPNAHREINRVLLCTSHAEPVDFVVTPMSLTRERADLLREADAIVHEEMQHAGLYEKIWQFPVVLLPVGTSKGGQSIVLRPIQSTDAMTADPFVLPEAVLSGITARILSLPEIQTVFFDMTSKPPGTIEWE